MTDLSDLYQRNVAVTGRFADWTSARLEILLKARGAWQISGSPSKGVAALISAEATGPKVDKATALGVPVVGPEGLRAALGPPLTGYLRRLNRAIADQPRYVQRAVFAVGAPASDAALARVEAQIGFPLPEDAAAFWRQLDGLSLLWATAGLGGQPRSSDPMPWSETCHDGGPLWTRISQAREANPGRFTMGLINIPPLDTLFSTPWRGRLVPDHALGPRDTIQLGRRKVRTQDLYDHLYGFDLFSPFTFAGLWADQESRRLEVVYGTDHGADWSLAATVPLETYLEFLLVDLGQTRPIEPTSKVGWPASIRRLAHLPWVELSPF